jgi:hypothetical protein
MLTAFLSEYEVLIYHIAFINYKIVKDFFVKDTVYEFLNISLISENALIKNVIDSWKNTIAKTQHHQILNDKFNKENSETDKDSDEPQKVHLFNQKFESSQALFDFLQSKEIVS